MRVTESEAKAMKREDFMNLLYKAWKEQPEGSRAVVEFAVKDPSENDSEGTYLEVVVLSDTDFITRDRWADRDSCYFSTRHPFEMYHLLDDEAERSP